MEFGDDFRGHFQRSWLGIGTRDEAQRGGDNKCNVFIEGKEMKHSSFLTMKIFRNFTSANERAGRGKVEHIIFKKYVSGSQSRKEEMQSFTHEEERTTLLSAE